MTSQAVTDEQLLRRMKEGDEAAFATLYERYQGLVYRFALHMRGNAAVAEEVTQETFLKLIREPERFEPARGTLGAYLFGIARNLTLHSFERPHAFVPLTDDTCSDELRGFSEDAIITDLSRAEGLRRLQKALLTLPKIYREAIVLCDLQEMSYVAAGELLGCSTGTIASRLHRGRTILQTRMRNFLCTR